MTRNRAERMTLLAKYTGPDGKEWQAHYFGADSFSHHILLVPPDESEKSAGWWQVAGETDVGSLGVEYWEQTAQGGLPWLRPSQEAFAVPPDRAIWVWSHPIPNTSRHLLVFQELSEEGPIQTLVSSERPVEDLTRAELCRLWGRSQPP